MLWKAIKKVVDEDSDDDLDSDQEMPEEDKLTSTFTALFPEDNFFKLL